jgi:U3 small nucleolar RNA-associated protein 18
MNTTAWDGANSQTDEEEKAVWVDSDDERLVVSLASNPRLRKLRVAESEDVINGKEYTKRLRRQFERLYPVPDWANPSAAAGSTSKKRRRPSNGKSSSEDASADDMSIDSDDLSVQPLAKLLQSSTEFLRASSSSSTRRKLRPEVIDIQRTKDVDLAQPVGSSSTFLQIHS